MSYVYAVAAYASSFVMLGIAKLISYCWKEKALYDEEQINPIISSEHVLVSQKKNAKAGWWSIYNFFMKKFICSAYNIVLKESFLSGKVKKEVARLTHLKSLGS